MQADELLKWSTCLDYERYRDDWSYLGTALETAGVGDTLTDLDDVELSQLPVHTATTTTDRQSPSTNRGHHTDLWLEPGAFSAESKCRLTGPDEDSRYADGDGEEHLDALLQRHEKSRGVPAIHIPSGVTRSANAVVNTSQTQQT